MRRPEIINALESELTQHSYYDMNREEWWTIMDYIEWLERAKEEDNNVQTTN